MSEHDDVTSRLLHRVSAGDASAVEELLENHRERLLRMVAFRMDRRMGRRVDASDVVQDAFMDATRKLPDYLERRPLPFYPWLRDLAWNRLVDLHRRHIFAQRRTVTRENSSWMRLSDHSLVHLADQFADTGTSPSRRLMREDVQQHVKNALVELKESDREVLLLRHLEEMSTLEVAAVLGVSEEAAKKRHLRALARLHQVLTNTLEP